MATLGRPRWGATLTEPSGRVLWQSVDNFSGWSFTRVLNDSSEAHLELKSDATLASRLEPWLHCLTIYADYEPVWHGIVINVMSSRVGLFIDAVDGSAFFKRRRLPQSRRWDQRDAAQAMSQLVVDGMGVSDPLRIADNIRALDSRIWVVVDEQANTVMIDDVISDLVDAGLQWTFLAGTLLIGPIMARYQTQQLTDAHLTGEVQVSKVGKDVMTDVLVTGEGVWAQRAIDDDRIVIQGIHKGDKLVTADECETLAKTLLDERGVAPLRVEVQESPLPASTPIGLDELVPGVRVPVSSRQTGIEVGVEMMIEKVAVDDGNVQLTLGMPDTSYEERQEFPPAPTMSMQSPWVIEQQDKNQKAAGKDKDETADWVKPGVPLG